MAVTTLENVDRGDVVTCTATFRNAAGSLADPTTVTFQVRNTASQVVTTYTNGTDSEVTKTSTGVFVLTLPIDVDRNHHVYVRGTGTVKGGANAHIIVTEDGMP
jgi:hypothetical protein